MACNTCNTPASSGGNLPESSHAYLTDPASAPSSACASPVTNPCTPQTSKIRWLSNFIPGWLQKITPATMGKLLIGVGDVLHYFKGANAGPLYFDGENVTVGAQPTLTASAKAESVHERGHLVLAKKVSKPQVLPSGAVANLDYYEFGVQALAEIDKGHLAGLTIDNTSGQVRVDAIKPVEIDSIKSGLPCGFRRLGYATEEIDGGCGKVDVERIYSYRGAVFGDDEILKEQSNGIPAVLVATTSACGETLYKIATPKGGAVKSAFTTIPRTEIYTLSQNGSESDTTINETLNINELTDGLVPTTARSVILVSDVRLRGGQSHSSVDMWLDGVNSKESGFRVELWEEGVALNTAAADRSQHIVSIKENGTIDLTGTIDHGNPTGASVEMKLYAVGWFL